MAKVYLVSEEQYHESSIVHGVYSTVEEAMKAHPTRWRDERYPANSNWHHVIKTAQEWSGATLVMREIEVDK